MFSQAQQHNQHIVGIHGGQECVSDTDADKNTVHSCYYNEGYIDSTAHYDTFFNTLPIQASSPNLSYIDSPDITIHFQSPSHIVITRVHYMCNQIVLRFEREK